MVAELTATIFCVFIHPPIMLLDNLWIIILFFAPNFCVHEGIFVKFYVIAMGFVTFCQ